jgi:hypothetical protein
MYVLQILSIAKILKKANSTESRKYPSFPLHISTNKVKSKQTIMCFGLTCYPSFDVSTKFCHIFKSFWYLADIKCRWKLPDFGPSSHTSQRLHIPMYWSQLMHRVWVLLPYFSESNSPQNILWYLFLHKLLRVVQNMVGKR